MATKNGKAAVKAPDSPYCYALVDPAGARFYIGKGVRGRMFQHATDAKRGKTGPKCDRIRAILAGGMEVGYEVLGTYSADEDACLAERGFIAAHKGLTNQSAGGESGGLSPKERMRRTARRALRGFGPVCQWVESLPDEWREAMTLAYGSPEQFHAQMREVLEREAVDPTPNVILVRADGSHEMCWE